MSTRLNHCTLFSALTLFTLGSLQIPVGALNYSASSTPRQETPLFYAQGSIRLAQASGNCRMIKEGGGIISASSSGAGGVVLSQGTLVEINLQNVVGNFIQVDKVSGKPRVGFVNKSFLALCKPIRTACYRVRDLPEIRSQGGLLVRKKPYINSERALLQLEVGRVFRVATPFEERFNDDRRWVKIAPINGVDGYVSDGPMVDSVKNLEPASCAGV